MGDTVSASAQDFIEDMQGQINNMFTELHTQKMNTSEVMGVLIGSAIAILANTALILEDIKEKVIHKEFETFCTDTTTKAIDKIYGDLDKFVAKYK